MTASSFCWLDRSHLGLSNWAFQDSSAKAVRETVPFTGTLSSLDSLGLN